MGVDLTTAWCEIEVLADSLAPLINEIVSGEDETYSQYSSVVRERLQKIRQLSQWARQASSEVQRRAAANRQLQQSQPLQTVSGPLAISPVGSQARVRTPVSSFQVASAPSDPVVQQAVQLQALVQQMGMAGTIRGTAQGRTAAGVYPHGPMVMGISPGVRPVITTSGNPGPPIKKQAISVDAASQQAQTSLTDKNDELRQTSA